MNTTWDNGGEAVEFTCSLGDCRAYGTVSGENGDDCDIQTLEAWDDSLGWRQVDCPPLSTLAIARRALERAWWDSRDWREKRRVAIRTSEEWGSLYGTV